MPPRTHVVDRSRALAAQALGYTLDGAPRVPWRVPALHAADARWADSQAVMLVHASAKAQKLLPAAWWIDLGQALARRGGRVLLPWGSDAERARAEQIAAGVNAQPGPPAEVLPRLPLDRLTAVMARLQGSIGLDTGLSHMSATLGRPTVQLFIEDKAWRAGAYWEPRTAIVQASEVAPPTTEQALQAWERVA